MPIRTGTMVSQSVRLERDLGAARLGMLWTARETTLDSEVEVRILAPELALDLDVLEAFIFEAQCLSRIDDPHVIRVLHVGVSPALLHFVVTERVDGQTLAGRVQYTGPLELSDAESVVRQTAGALSAAHRLGILHRGVSPAKILLRQGPAIDVKLIDFDIANQHSHPVATRRGMTVEAAASMSPENLLTPEEIDARADVWSLAVCAYYAVTGHMPFAGASYADLFADVDRSRFRPASELRPGLSPRMDDFFSRAFRTDIEERFITAAELADAFGRAAHQPAKARVPVLRLETARPLSDAPMAMDTTDDAEAAFFEAVAPKRRWSRALAPAALVLGVLAAGLLVRYQPDAAATAASMSSAVGGQLASSIEVAAADAARAVPADMILDQIDPPSAAVATPVVTVPASRAAPAGRAMRAREARVDKIDDDPAHRVQPAPERAPVSDNPYEDGKPDLAPAAPKTSVDDPGF